MGCVLLENNMKKRIIYSSLMSISTILSLVACAPADSLKEPGAEVITIYVRDFEDWSNDYFEAAINRYNDNVEDGVEIKYEILSDSVYTYKVQSSRDAGNAPDIYMVAYQNIWQEQQGRYIKPLNDVFEQEFFDDYTPTALDATTLYGDVYGVPYCFEPSMLLFYSKSMFKEAGITKEPQTYAEMLEACEKLSKVIDRNQTVLATPLGTPMGWANVGQFYNAADGNFPISDDWSKSLVSTLNFDGYKEFLEYYSSLYNNAYASRSDNAGGYNEIIGELCEGRVAMTFAGSYAVGQIYQDYIANGYIEDASDIGCCLAPRKNLDMGATANGGWAFVLDSQTTSRVATNEKVAGKTHAELAADFLNWYVRDTEVATGFFELGMCCKQTGFKSIQNLLDVSQAKNPYYAVIKEAANTAVPMCSFPHEITKICSDMIGQLTSRGNEMTVEQVIGKCHVDVEKEIKQGELEGKNPNVKN